MARIVKEIVVKNAQGLHARPAALFVQIASRYNSEVTIQKDDERVNGKSIMGLLMLGVQPGVKVILDVEGEDADKVLPELEELLTKGILE
ncbi:MAG: HPr family phosphocarrier protein [Candidatus Omnitrophica bacterium]|nr:HPr family phosphocarrier protein [Candidatus Omnitrophota bacterium]